MESIPQITFAQFGSEHVTIAPLKFDEIGNWSELKLEIVENYGAAYTRAFANQRGLKKYYIDAFSGAGVHLSKRTGQQVEGSPARALKVSPSFDHFYFIDMNAKKTKYLATLCRDRADVDVITDDATSYLVRQLLPTIQYKKFNRALCLLDPYGLHLDWDVMFQAGQSRAIDLFLNFPVMDMNRNAIWHNPENAPKDGVDRMNRFWVMSHGAEPPMLRATKATFFWARAYQTGQRSDRESLSGATSKSSRLRVRSRSIADAKQQ
jgi:three-Cys-motif partner protein